MLAHRRSLYSRQGVWLLNEKLTGERRLFLDDLDSLPDAGRVQGADLIASLKRTTLSRAL